MLTATGRGRWAAPVLLVLTLVALTASGCGGLAARQPGASSGATAAASTPTLAASPTRLPGDQTATLAAVALRPARRSSPDGLEATGAGDVVVLRSAPAADARVVAQVTGARVLWAEGRTSDGGWLWVSYDEAGRHGWAATSDLQLRGDPLALPSVLRSRDIATPAPSPTRAPLIADKPAVMPTATASPVPTATRAAPAATARPSSPTPAPAPAAGRLLIQPAVGEIYLMNADGSGLQRLTNGIDPVFAPDGRRIAFTRWGPPDGLYILDLVTGQEQRVTQGDGLRGPTWSPDGGHIAFSRVSGQVLCLDTPIGCFRESVIREFFEGKDCIETPYGRYCISDFAMVLRNEVTLAAVSTVDGAWTDLAAQAGAQSPAWHPYRNEIVYKGSSGLQVMSLDGQTRPLVDNPALASPIWSPDGSRIAAQARVHDHWEVFVLDANGNTLARVTEPAPLSPRAPNNVAPAWSPDGNELLFLTDREGPWRLYRTNLDGSAQAPFQPQALAGLTFNYDYAAERVVSWSR